MKKDNWNNVSEMQEILSNAETLVNRLISNPETINEQI